MIIQLSGAISYDCNWRSKFNEVATKIEGYGHLVINPVDIEQYINSSVYQPSYYDYLNECLELIQYTDAMFFLKDWKISYGAKLEYKRAFEKGKLLIFQGINEHLLNLNKEKNARTNIYQRAA